MLPIATWHRTLWVVLSDRFRKWISLLLASEPYVGNESALARDLGLSQSYISKLYGGDSKGKIGLDTIEKIASSMGHPSWLVIWAIEEGYPIPKTPTPARFRNGAPGQQARR